MANESEIVDTRPASCPQHGEYRDQLIKVRTWEDLKAVLLDYWLGCPRCRELMEEGNRIEAKRMLWLNSLNRLR